MPSPHWPALRRARAALTVGLLIASATTAQAQATAPVIRGRVIDATTERPVVGAKLQVVEHHASETTHLDGTFAFPVLPAGVATLRVSAIGYAPTTRQVDPAMAAAPLTIALQPTALELEPIVVTGTITARPGADVLSPTTVLAGARLDRRADATLAGTLAGTPGLAVTSTGPATARPVIRGLSGDRIVILEDGIRPGDLSSTSSDHAVAIDALTAEQLDVVRGPMSLLYGSSALGGVVNVVRNEVPRSRPEHPHGELRAQGMSVNRGTALGGWLNGATGPLAYRVEGSGRRFGDTRTPEGSLTNTDGTTLQAGLGAALVGAGGHAGAAYRYYDSDYGIPGGFIGGHPAGVNIAMRRHTVRAEAERHPAGRFDLLRASAMLTDYRHEELESDGDVGTSFDQTVAVADLAGRHGVMGPAALGALGLRAQYRDIRTAGSLRTPSTWDVTLAGYLVEEFGLGPVTLQSGLRYDWARYEPRDTTAFISVGGERVPVRPRTFGSVSAALGGILPLGGGVRTGLNLARAFRTPDFNELYSNGPHLAANSYDVGDPALSPETGVGVDAWIRLERPALRAELAVFGNWLNDYIFPSSEGRAELGSQGGVPRFQYTNEDARFTGAEGSLALQVAEAWIVEGTASWVAGRFTSDRAPIPVITSADTTFVPASRHPPLMPPLSGRLEVRHETPGWFAGATARLTARQGRTGDFETPTAGYGLLDLFAGVRLALGGRLHSVVVRADNLLDKSYRDHLSRLKEVMPMPGRGFTLNYRLGF